MTPALRKFTLVTHVTASVGWLGSVVAFLALSVAGVGSANGELVRAAYVAMHFTTWYVIVPLGLASFATGIIEGLGTTWGLFRHYWVVTKLFLTLFATFLLLLHTQPIGQVAAVASQASLAAGDLRSLRLQLVGDASAALFVLLLTTTLSVYKPWGMTSYGRRKLAETAPRSIQALDGPPAAAGWWVLAGLAAFVILVVLVHLLGGGMTAHR
jgi:hypothetical protein